MTHFQLEKKSLSFHLFQNTSVVAKMRQCHTVQVLIWDYINKFNLYFEGECINDECKGSCDSVEAKVNGNETMGGFKMKSLRKQSKRR